MYLRPIQSKQDQAIADSKVLLSSPAQRFLDRHFSYLKDKKAEVSVSKIHVDEISSKIASLYEKVRKVVDWKEEHLMRRTAIIRKLKRRFLEIDLKPHFLDKSIAEPLILELIRGGHFPNDSISESKIGDIQKIIDKYAFVLKNSPSAASKRAELQFYNWIIEIAACEIEENLASFRKERTLIDFMFESMKERIILGQGIIKAGGLKEEEKDILIYIAVQQALFKLDAPIISYNLIKYQYPTWGSLGPELFSDLAKNIYKIWENIENYLSHPLGRKFYAICEKYDTPYLLLGDILAEESASEITRKISQPKVLTELIKNVYNKRLSTLKRRLFRAAFYSTLSVLLTNAFSVMIIEMPVAKLIYGFFSKSPLLTISVDILGPTFLMFLMVVTIKSPSKSNLDIVIAETMKIVYQKEKIDTYEIKVSRKKGLVIKTIISFIYLVGAFISFGLIYFVFTSAQFPITSVIINILFVALIVFAGLAVRERGRELTIEEKKASIVGFMFDILLVPVAGTGRWLSIKWKKYNAIAAFFNALIDMPFVLFVEFIEQWRFFLKEKKEEIH